LQRKRLKRYTPQQPVLLSRLKFFFDYLCVYIYIYINIYTGLQEKVPLLGKVPFVRTRCHHKKVGGVFYSWRRAEGESVKRGEREREG